MVTINVGDFDIGDTIYFLHKEEILSGPVTKIEIVRTQLNGVPMNTIYYYSNVYPHGEIRKMKQEVFGSAGALINYLESNNNIEPPSIAIIEPTVY